MKMWNYVFLAVGLSILFEFAGIIPSGGILDLIGFSRTGDAITFNFSASNLWNEIWVELLVGFGSGIFIGFITRSSPENFIILPFITSTIVIFISIFSRIIIETLAVSSLWVSAIVVLLLAPFMVGFVIAAYEHFRGTD